MPTDMTIDDVLQTAVLQMPENAWFRDAVVSLKEKNEQLTAENQRLREELERIERYQRAMKGE